MEKCKQLSLCPEYKILCLPSLQDWCLKKRKSVFFIGLKKPLRQLEKKLKGNLNHSDYLHFAP